MIPLSSRSRKRAFTLIELLVVLSIIAMLGVIAAPEFTRTLERARSTACLGNLRSLGVAVNSFVSDND
ncbi:MAG: prepilin-type N-terminal cleavage/methylation domain-containing protein [Terrimicrobiaceae bacterium]